MPNIGLDDIRNILEKSGVPFGDSDIMSQALPFVRGQIEGATPQNTAGSDAMKQQYMQQIDKIASMDQKLSQVYGDPNSKLYLEHPLDRERAKSPALNILGKSSDIFAERVNRQINTESQEFDQTVDLALDIYEDLIREQASIEKEEGKATKKAGTTSSRAGGGKVTKRQSLAGFRDFTAANFWTNVKDNNFKREWVSNILQYPEAVPDEGFTIDDVKDELDRWNRYLQQVKDEDVFGFDNPDMRRSTSLEQESYSSRLDDMLRGL